MGYLQRHALITAIGDSINRMIPPLIATKKDVDLLVERMRGAALEAATAVQAA